MWKRIGALVRKEFIQLRRDRRTLAMMIMLPLVWLVAFGYAVNFDVQHLRVFAVDKAKNDASRDVLKRVNGYEKLDVIATGTEEEARAALKKGTADVAILFPEHFRLLAHKKDEQMRIWVDGSRLFTAQSAVRKLNEVLRDVQKENIQKVKENLQNLSGTVQPPAMELPPGMGPAGLPPQAVEQVKQAVKSQVMTALQKAGEEMKKKAQEQLPDPDAMAPTVDVLYNPDLKSANYMIPGLLGLVLIFITTLMTALGVVREKERGTLEQLIVSPLTSLELILGKLLPYMLIATLDFVLVFAVGTWLFHVPFKGDLLSFLLAALLFLFASLGLGLLVSTVSQNQQQAMQLAVMTLVPQIILSGFVFPLEAMPAAIRWLSYLMPLTYFLPISRDAFLKGMSAWDHPLPLAALAFFAVLFLLVATVRFKRSLA
jgi:ABC-2 type transport system permease protein